MAKYPGHFEDANELGPTHPIIIKLLPIRSNGGHLFTEAGLKRLDVTA